MSRKQQLKALAKLVDLRKSRALKVLADENRERTNTLEQITRLDAELFAARNQCQSAGPEGLTGALHLSRLTDWSREHRAHHNMVLAQCEARRDVLKQQAQKAIGQEEVLGKLLSQEEHNRHRTMQRGIESLLCRPMPGTRGKQNL